MNRTDFEKHLRANGCSLHRHGAKHDMWVNSANGNKAAVPRHKTIKKPLVRGVCAKLGIPTPPGI
ncbi:type II toxin-antitoxin system HicA family toxin [Gemmata sp. G18]|uniref:Type II toxin-antitoxin system HicA family toxin n=1 Tax=Gemmata palustris TaxID=2822762 RepID=A0ABS5BYA9_9BACT|nr:type II toxin-antitoxin system HicA family toxin [Gemmata palustris]MBP3958726.1 type II toxin-antitoxin system HicA family toxin [Gemmata palustris]